MLKYAGDSSPPIKYAEERRQAVAEQPGVIPHDGPLHPRYASVAARLRTFDQWPPALKQKPQVMAEAGFIYLGLSDQVKCFYCDGGLKEWGEEDDPWVEHAGWYYTCGFMRLVRGDQYIERCRQLVNMTLVSTGYHIIVLLPSIITGKQEISWQNRTGSGGKYQHR